ncbi:ferritin-like domain-containing protein [Planctomicrobium piriforme]|uniref:Ferritin-like n=1 Tax=Planctomicrobium piriforme TaxID=1576369 RepID=A0A1I3JDM2_9PLAN|nr:ferritin-like domain-containing protein [Planctomicrobium piriforme]SFI58304.1 Ferritin-like [Planctomicrobium piriforme]
MGQHNRFRGVRFEWVGPPPLPQVAAPGPPVGSIQEHLHRYGHLHTSGAASPQDELIALLQLAVEVEHALLVQYLYAASSIAAPLSFHRKVLHISIQEMAHLITVENLLLAVGGPSTFHIGRDSIRGSSPLNPLPLDLEPISRLSLAKYILAEAPATFPSQHAQEEQFVSQLSQEVETAAGITPHRVGALYARIYWIVQSSDAPAGPISLTPDPAIGFQPGWHLSAADFTSTNEIAAHQAEPLEWEQGSGPDLRIHLVTDEASALGALASVMEQGEGLGHAEDSHYYEFKETLTAFMAGQMTVLPLPVNPFVGSLPPDVAGGVRIIHPYVRLWATLLNIRYTALLLHIGHALLTPRGNAAREILVQLAFINMRLGLSPLMSQMKSTFLRSLDPASAPTFELLRQELPIDLSDCWGRQTELLELERQVRNDLLLRAELAADSSGSSLLADLQQQWDELKAFVDSQ